MDQKIGQMDPAYFLGRREILEFINSTCDVNLTKVEQTCTGAIACQLLDAIKPSVVPMSKIDWLASNVYQYTTNYKVLQNAFAKLGIDKPIGVDKLCRGRYQDNLEFMQWFKAFYDLNGNRDIPYDALAKRSRGKGGNTFLYNRKNGGAAAAKTATTSVKNAKTLVRNGSTVGKKNNSSASGNKGPSVTSTRNNVSLRSTGSNNNDEINVARNGSCNEAKESSPSRVEEEQKMTICRLEKSNDEFETRHADLVESLQALEKERDFYFTKLREVEVYLQEQDDNNNGMVKHVLDILYAAEGEGNGGEGPEENAMHNAVDADGEEQNDQNQHKDSNFTSSQCVPEEEILEEEPVITH